MGKADMGDEDDPDDKGLQKVALSQKEVEMCLFCARLSHKPTTVN